MKRGVVMSVNKKQAIVLTADGQFLRAPISGKAQIGEEITFEEEYKLARTCKPVFRYSGAAAVVLLFILPMLLFFGRDAHPVVAYLSMDINPSVEIGVDKEDKVRELRALNEDGERIIQGLSYKGMNVEDVAASILQQAKGSHYLDLPNREIFIASVLLGGKDGLKLDYETILTKKVDEAIRGLVAELSAENASVNVTTLSVPHEVRDAAAANGISAGKMAVYLMAKEEGYKLDIEQIQKQSITKATEPIGGVKTIVEQADKSKEKLKQLVAQEKKEKAKRQKDEQKAAKATPSSTAGANKPEKAEKPKKPVSSKTERDDKPTDRKFAGESGRDGERDDKDREKGRDRSGNDDNDGGGNDRRKDRNDGDDDENRNGNGENSWNRDDDRDNKQGDDRSERRTGFRSEDRNANEDRNRSRGNERSGNRDDDKKREFDEDSDSRRNGSSQDERNSREKRDN